jgi:hypothetical protein
MAVWNLALIDDHLPREYPLRQIVLLEEPLQLNPCLILALTAVLEGDVDTGGALQAIQQEDKLKS